MQQCLHTSCPVTLFGWFADKVAPNLIAGVVIALLGSWLLARLNESAKGRREHLIKTVDRLLDALDGLQKAASEYWSTAGASGSKEASIEYLIQVISTLLTTCASEMFDEDSEMDSLFVRLAAEAVTDQFGTAARIAEPDRGRLVATISARLSSRVIEARGRIVRDTVRAQIGRWVGSPVGTAYIRV